MTKNLLSFILAFPCFIVLQAQQVMTPELLWTLGRVTPYSLTPDGKAIYYGITRYSKTENKSSSQLYLLDIASKKSRMVSNAKQFAGDVALNANGIGLYSSDGEYYNFQGEKIIKNDLEHSNLIISPSGKKIAFSREIKAMQMKADLYPELPKSDIKIYDDLMFRHWNVWEDGLFNHIHIADFNSKTINNEVDIMPNEAFDSPTQPGSGIEDMAWSADEKWLVYVCVKKFGKEYAVSTNSDLYAYDLVNKKTTNLTEINKGYDKNPVFSPDGKYLAWTSMKRDGYEADKNDIIVKELSSGRTINVNEAWDESVQSFIFDKSGNFIYFNAPYRGIVQLFQIDMTNLFNGSSKPQIKQITQTDFDYPTIIGQADNFLYCTRTDMNHAAEIYRVSIKNGSAFQLSSVNDSIYNSITLSKIEKKWIQTTDGKQMLSWIIFPPNFDSTKKYPTLLYCQGGPQSALSQFYSFRWNFQLMAANGYIIVAPNRRGMPGWGTEWNEQISGDWGGQAMKDYLSAIDQVSKEPFVDINRRGSVGASFGGYSVMMLAGIHENRFKTFISHCGTYNLESWYDSTEEIWFADFDLKGAYWNQPKADTYEKHSPHKFIQNWNTPILIIQGARDYRIPDSQAFEAFTAARLKNIKSRLVYIPDEGHHILKIQNGLVWQGEFFRWLKETLW